MKILSKKKSICTTMKVLYEKIGDTYEDYYKDMEQKKKEGWKVVTKPDYYNERREIVMKSSSNGIVITYIRYDKM